MRRFATLAPALIAVALLAPAAASARVVLVATGDGAATLTDVVTNQIVARIPVGGRSRAAVAAPDGSRGYVAAGTRVLGIDLATRLPVGAANLAGAAGAPAGRRARARPRRARRGGRAGRGGGDLFNPPPHVRGARLDPAATRVEPHLAGGL